MDILVPPEFEPLWKQDDEHPVVKYPAEILRQVAEPVQKVSRKTRELVEKMERIITRAHGIGLAAPQVGMGERIVLVSENGKRPLALINPKIVFEEGGIIGEEGCLSLPGLYGEVPRKAIVEVEALDEDGRQFKRRFEGLSSRVVQHEIDHLDGILFIDKAEPTTLHWAWPAGVSDK